MTKFRILDLDNCISDDEWRIGNIRWDIPSGYARFNDYHMLSAFDHPSNRDLFDFYEGTLVICTARPVAYESITRKWLERNGIFATHLYMRHNGDHRSSVDVKREVAEALIAKHGLEAIEACYDDREDIVEMYRSLGLTAHVRKIHNTPYGVPKGVNH